MLLSMSNSMAVGWSEIVAAFLHDSLRLLSLHTCLCLAQTYFFNNLADLYVKLRIYSYTGIKGYGKPLKTNPNLCCAFTLPEFVFITGISSSGLTLGLKAKKVLSSCYSNIRGGGRCLGDLYCVCVVWAEYTEITLSTSSGKTLDDWYNSLEHCYSLCGNLIPMISTPSKIHQLIHILPKVWSTEHWQGRGCSSWNKYLAGGLHRKAFINMLLDEDKSVSLWLRTCFLSEWPINVLHSNRPSILKVLIAPNQEIKQVILPLFSVF